MNDSLVYFEPLDIITFKCGKLKNAQHEAWELCSDLRDLRIGIISCLYHFGLV